MTGGYTPAQRLRAAPTPAWIATIRARFPVERSIDEVLTRKLENRARPAEHRTDFGQLAARLVKRNILVNAIAPGPFPTWMLSTGVGTGGDVESDLAGMLQAA